MNEPLQPEPAQVASPYEPPRLRRFGSAAELTQSRSMIGMMDGGGGGGGMNRTG